MGHTAPIRFAAISDIHGNSDALAAVLGDIDASGITDIVNLGDHLSGPLAAKKTADMLMARKIICIRGNHDRWLVDKPPGKMNASDQCALAQLGGLHMQWLRDLPATMVLWDKVFLCHAIPGDDTVYWMHSVADDGSVLTKNIADIEALAADISQPLLLCGHTHLPKSMPLSGVRLLVNPGSVGCPAYDDANPRYHVMQSGTPDACYAILDRSQGNWAVEFRRVGYDSRRMVRLARENQRPDWAQALATGRLG